MKIIFRMMIMSLWIGFITKLHAQTINQDSVIYEKYMTESSKYRNKPINELVVLTGKYFLERPYVASTLEINNQEELVINLREFDCTTFVENNIALAMEVKKGNRASFEGYKNNLKNIRYRNGVIDGYVSRIHYSSDWTHENENIAKNITLALGGTIVKKPLSFMSANSQLYPHMKNNKTNRQGIRRIEKAIDKRNNYTLIPKAKIKQAAQGIKTGDIIIFGINVQGLDYSHIGIATWENGVLRLLHASSVEKKVVVDSKNLVDYSIAPKSRTGITVLRLKDID